MKTLCLQVAVAILTAAGTLHAGQAPPPKRAPNPKPPPAPPRLINRAPPRLGPAPGQHPLDYWQNLSPQQREAQLSRLKPERAANIRRRLDNWNKLTPQQKDVARSMTPEKRKIASDHRAWLVEQPPERQQAIVRQTRLLREMSPEARQAELQSPTFRRRFDATEREHIRNIISIIPDANHEEIE